MVARCPSCQFMFDAPPSRVLPGCPQCGGVTESIEKIEAKRERPNPPSTLKFSRADVLPQ